MFHRYATAIIIFILNTLKLYFFNLNLIKVFFYLFNNIVIRINPSEIINFVFFIIVIFQLKNENELLVKIKERISTYNMCKSC